MIVLRVMIWSFVVVILASSAVAGDMDGVNGSAADQDGIGGFRSDNDGIVGVGADTDGIAGLRGDGDGVTGLHGGMTLGIGPFTMARDDLEEVIYLRALVNLLQWESLFPRGH